MKNSAFFLTADLEVEIIYTVSGKDACRQNDEHRAAVKVVQIVLREGKEGARGMTGTEVEEVAEIFSFLRGFFAGEAPVLNWNLLALDGIPEFSRRVMRRCTDIPPGRVSSYGELAQAVGNPLAARAVGNAMARNPFPLLIPCHRVIKSTGGVGRYGAGPGIKKLLLAAEGVAVDKGEMVSLELFQHDFGAAARRGE